ncbi:DUF3995 domain-containing protein [Streptomyces cinnamoneus]|uniref:DUF3995 domain-containing protein n=1 Tax=Streptomyces cinnamoneus TaxID=53446 RepID=A0A918WK97_STRCJ|nr:DUF3995 domain-containing protein [Streptomyces cinnamoneus]GHC59322.1 hypothetical protein GCM10010507_40380 [Streptomyces cinnamoneus]
MSVTGTALDGRTGRTAGVGEAAGAEPGRAVRVAAAVAAGGLIAAGALHAVWVFSPWPLESRAEFATVVVGVDEAHLPSAPLTFAVAGLLGVAGSLVLAGARPPAHRLSGSWPVRAGLWTVAGVLGVRGLGGLVASGLGLGDVPAEHRHWDLVLYSPLCVTLGGLAGYVALRTRRRSRTPKGRGVMAA